MRSKILVAAAIFLAMRTPLSCMKREPAQLPSVDEFVESISRCLSGDTREDWHLVNIKRQHNPAWQDNHGFTIIHCAAKRDGIWGGPFILTWVVYWAQVFSLEHDPGIVFPESMGSREEKYVFLQNLDPIVHKRVELLLHVPNNGGKTPYGIAGYATDADGVLKRLEAIFPKPKITHQEPDKPVAEISQEPDQPATETSCVLS